MLSETPVDYRQPPLLSGNRIAGILQTLPGLSDADVDGLRRQNVIH
jgi:hypothetical protein